MKTYFSKFSRTVNFFYLLVFIMVVVGCNFTNPHKHIDNEALKADTVFASPTDSLEYILKTGTSDEKMLACINLSSHYSTINYRLSRQYASELLRLSLEEKNKIMESKAYNSLGITLMFQNINDSALLYFQKALHLYEEENEEEEAMRVKIRITNVLGVMGKYDEALKLNFECLEYFTKKGDNEAIVSTLHTIGASYGDMQMNDLAIEYYRKELYILETMEKTDFTRQHMGSCYSNIGNSLWSENKYIEALDYIEKGLSIYKKDKDFYFIGMTLLLRYYCYQSLNKTEEALQDLEEVENIAQMLNNDYLIHEALVGKGKIYMNRKQYKQAFGNFKQALALIDSTEKRNMYDIYQQLAEASSYAGTPVETYTFIGKLVEYAKDVFSEEWSQKMTEMEVKYETEKKELRIASLEDEKRLMTWLGISAGVVLVLGLAALFFLWRFTVQKRQLAEQQIKQLQQEKQLIATQAVLDGETQERTRLARDLHDGLGSMLTGVKLNLELLKRSVVLNPDEVKYFDNAMSILGNSTLEMRRIAHHLMPDALSRFGLKAALNDFCADFPIIEFVWFGSVERLDDHQLEVMIYRIIHELVNNALKHSGATKIGMNVMHDADYIAFTVYDNGCGFDKEQQTKGMGLQNIRERVSACNGRLDINTNVDKGTEVNVELRIEN